MSPHTYSINALSLKNASLCCTKALINGTWLLSHSQQTYPIFDPAHNTPILQIASCDIEDANLAIGSATAALQDPAWKDMPPKTRAHLLQKWSRLIEENAQDLAILLTMENGKPISESKAEILLSSRYFEYYGEEANRILGHTIPYTLSNERRQWTISQPVGVVGLITPWNFPSSIPARKLAPAIAAGCTVIMKPASETPLSALALGYLGLKAGLPPGVLNILPACEAKTPKLGNALLSSPHIAKISFTGSSKIGHLIKQNSGLKRLSLELGGNAPFIIMPDLNSSMKEWKLALDGLMKSKFRAAGQTCICANRIFIHASKISEFVSDIITYVTQINLGHGMDENTQLGPLMRARDVERVKSWIYEVKSQSPSFKVEYDGSKQTVQLESSGLKGHFMCPVILSGLDPLSDAAQEEIFGPVIAIYSYDTEEQLIEWANNTKYGLVAYVYTADYKRMLKMSEVLHFGMIGINESLLTTVEVPFGGVKESGFGKEGSKLGIEEYLQIKLVALGGCGN